MLNAVDKNEKFLPFVSVKVAAAARCFSASITSIFPRFSRHGISTERLKSPKLDPFERFHARLGISSPLLPPSLKNRMPKWKCYRCC